jgi:uncharacterized protein
LVTVPPRTDSLDLAGLHLSSGQGRRLELQVGIEPCALGGEAYQVEPPLLPVQLDISRTTGEGYSLRLRFEAVLTGPCMRCLATAAPRFSVDAWEISQPGHDHELSSPYVARGALELGDWARDALALALPAQVLCRSDCAGLCPECGADLNSAGSEHRHQRAQDPRWAKLSEVKFD